MKTKINLSFFRLICLNVMVFFTGTIYAQVVGGRQNNQPSVKEVKAAALNKGAATSDVNLFNGTLNSSYTLGKVSCPSGLSFTLSSSYSSTYTCGGETTISSGIPYGEGWTLNLPRIVITNEAFINYDETTSENINSANDDNNCFSFSTEQALNEGRLFWFEPTVIIPGVINERFIYKYTDVSKGIKQFVFVPHKFSSYVEAILEGGKWKVKLDDGTEYRFETATIGYRTPSNRRVYKDKNITGNRDITQYSDALKQLYLPKEEVLSFYCSSITNPNQKNQPNITFSYEKFGKFNHFQEFSNLMLSLRKVIGKYIFANGGSTTTGNTEALVPEFDTYKDLLLTKIISSNVELSVIEQLELTYNTLTSASTVDMLKICEDGVYRLDSLYNYRTVWSQGVNTTQEANVLGSDALNPITNTCYTPYPNTISTNFNNWQRYHHGKSDQSSLLLGKDNTSINISPFNPYKVDAVIPGSSPCSGNYYTRSMVNTSANIPFNHSFLESPRIGLSLPPGDIYEVRSLIYSPYTDSPNDYSKSFCNFDINIVTGENLTTQAQTDIQLSSLANTSVCETVYDSRRYHTLFSTFNNAIKWNTAGNRKSFSDPNAGLLKTSNLFVMPNLPNEYQGFHIQIGAAGSDNKYDFNWDINQGITNPDIGSAKSTYYNIMNDYKHQFNPTDKDDVEPSENLTPAFGVGMPWHCVDWLEGMMEDAGNYGTNKRYKFWWFNINGNYGSNPINYPNLPTRADANVTLNSMELVRYCKNPYMLSSVKHYKTSGAVDCSDVPEGKVLVNQLDFEYKLQTEQLLSSVLVNNTFYNEQSTNWTKNVFLLEKIIQIPVNSSMNSPMSVASKTTLPTSTFNYVFKRFSTGNNASKSISGFYLLNKITDQLGGETNYEFYEPADPNTFWTNMHDWADGFYAYKGFYNRVIRIAENQNLYRVEIPVKRKYVLSPTNSMVKDWNYTYTNPVSYNKGFGLGIHFRRSNKNVENGFTNTTVTQPALAAGTGLNTSVYEHYTTNNSNDLKLFGKIKSVKEINAGNTLLSSKDYEYGTEMAFLNGIYRSNTEYNYVYASSEYDDNYSTQTPEITQDINMGQTAFNYQFLESTSPDLFIESSKTEQYLHSFFMPVVKETNTEYDNDEAANDISLSRVQAPAANTTSTRIINNVTSPGIPLPIPGTIIIPSNYITHISEYQFWDANRYGNPVSDAYLKLYNISKQGKLQFEPSWQLFRKTSYSPQMPDAYTKQEHFYYYDLLNDYINIDFFAIRAATGGSGGLYASSNFPILYHQFKNKVRNISYQTINISKTTCLPEESVSQYSIYNNIWKNEYLFPYNRTDNKDVHRPAATAPRAGDGTSSPNTLIEDLLFNRVLLSYSAVQLDTVRIDTAYSRLRNPYSVNGINNSSNEVLRFKSVKTTDPSVRDRDYVVEYPHDTLLVKYIDERENNGLVKLEHNAAGLYTRYRYAKGTKVRVVDITPPYRNYNYDEIFNYAEPIKVITGFGLSDSLWVDYKYNVDNSINTITTTNGAKTSFEYDEFSRLHKSYLNGLLLNINKYSNFNNNQNLSFEARAEQNFVETFILLDTAQQFKNIAEHSMSIIDPLGRNYDILSQISYNYSSSNPNQVLSTLTLHKGLSIFDNWDRVVKQYKPFVEISANPQMKPAFNNLNSPYTEAIYENNTRSKVIKAAKYGENISTGHTVGSGYRIIDGNQLTAEIMTGDDPTLFKVICDPNLASSMKFLKAVIQDEDGKKHISYVNANGQEIATKSYVSSGNAVLTQKIYDSRANLITTINPSFQSTFMKYNLLGQLYQKRSVDNGTEYYMYNSTGQVVLLQDSNGRAGIEDNAKPFLRLFTYDKYGRPVTQEKWVIKTGSNPLSYMVLINVPNGIKAPFTYATTNDRHFNWYTTTTVNGVQVKTAVSPYTLLTSPNTEKKWFYGEAKPGIVTGVFAPEIVNYMNVAANKATNVKGNLSVTYSYNLGKLTEIRIFSYDNADRPKYEVIQYSAGTVKIPSIIKYPEYNLRGSVKTQVIDYGLNGDDLKYEYGYDGWNRLLSVKLNGKLTARFEHDDALGLIKQVEYFDQCANGKTLSIDTLRYTYDIRDRLTQIKSLLYTEKLCYDYDVPQPNAWDATLVSSTINFNGNINGTTHIINTNRASNAAILNGMMDKPTYYGYTYDGINRLTKADASVMNVLKAALNTSVLIPENNYGDESLVYDNVGNIRSLKRGMYYSPNSSNPANWVQNWNYNYVSGTNRLSSVDSNGVVLRNYGYDGNGNIRNDSYRKLNSLRLNRGNLNSRVSIGSGASLKGFDYDYDINDNRVYKKNMVSNSNEEYYLTDFSGKVHGVYTLADKQWKWYVYALNRMQEISNSGKKYIVSDHLGSTRVTYTANISTCNLNSTVYTITGAYDYYAFGKILRSYTGNSKDKFKFGGKEKDEETNLDYFGARNLDDDINRWTAVDPLKDARLAWNPYNYCRNNPINNVDPNGMVDGWVQDKETQEYTWDKNVNSQEDFDKSGYDKDKFSYAGQEFQVASSLGSTAGLYTLYYGSDGTIKTYDYPMWVEAGKSHIGLKEGNNAEIQSMIDKHNEDFPSENGAKAINNDKDPWCGVFVYSCLKESGTMVSQKPNTWQKPALNSFYNTNWKEGVKVDNPVFGAIAVMKYGHVGIVVGYNDKQIFLLGGNQPQNNSPIRDGVEVNIRELNRSLVKDYVIPQNYLAPPLPNFH